MNNYSTITHKYAYLWNKYRPAILRMMIDSNLEPQTYKLSKHEFQNVNSAEKGSYAFVLEVYKSKSVTDIRKTILAKDLLLILQNSGKATELTETATYIFTLDKHFILKIEYRAMEEEASDEDENEETNDEVVDAEIVEEEVVQEEVAS
ncbi:MAG: hypothetical protein NWS46_06750 [Cyclobacteriaceae bacterium]|jgi:hypothetical protein|nr:hypothetical protein [Cyclobacteriaceae bacterium]